MIIETCPKCGHTLSNEVIATLPPIPVKVCYRCGWRREGKQEEIKFVPFKEDVTKTNLKTEDYLGMDNTIKPSNYCKNCPNYPSNGGSGFCNCTLGQIPVTY